MPQQFRNKAIFSPALAALAAFAATCTPSSAYYYTSPPIHPCGESGVFGLSVSSGDSCLEISGAVDAAAGWSSHDGTLTTLDGYARFAAVDASDIGQTAAVLRVGQMQRLNWIDGSLEPVGNFGVDQAYVSVGHESQLTVGMKDTIAYTGGDNPFSLLSHVSAKDATEDDNTGVGWTSSPFFGSDPSHDVKIATGGTVIQATRHTIGSVSLGAGIEDLEGTGTFVGTARYASDQLYGHVTVARTEALSNRGGVWAMHTAATASYGRNKLRAAGAANSAGWWNAMASAEGHWGRLSTAATFQATSNRAWAADGSIGIDLSDNMRLEAGVQQTKWDPVTLRQIETALSVELTDSLTLTGKIGHIGYLDYPFLFAGFAPDVTYAELDATWTPSSDFTAYLTAAANDENAYKVTIETIKTFQ